MRSVLMLVVLLLSCAQSPIRDVFMSVGHLTDGPNHCTAVSVAVTRWLGAAHCSFVGKMNGEDIKDVKMDEAKDLRLMDGPLAPPLPIAQHEPELGESVTVYGWTDALAEVSDSQVPHPLVFFGHVQMLGVSMRVEGLGAKREKNLFDMGAGPGMSGGPILNARGELVGMTQAVLVHPAFSVVSPTVKDIRSFLGLR